MERHSYYPEGTERGRGTDQRDKECLEERKIKGLFCLLIGIVKTRSEMGLNMFLMTLAYVCVCVCVFVQEADIYLCTVMD